MTTTEDRSGSLTRHEPGVRPAAPKWPRRQQLATPCPDCGQVLVRPADFSAERLLYLHRKWGACVP